MCEDVNRLLSSRELADSLQVSESSVKRWVDMQLIPAFKTPGGHRRIALVDAMKFIRENQLSLKNPAALGLQSPEFLSTGNLEEFEIHFRNAFVSGDLQMIETLLHQLSALKLPLEDLAETFVLNAYRFVRAKCDHPSEECVVLHRTMDLLRDLLPLAARFWRLPYPSSNQLFVFADVGYYMDSAPVFVAEMLVRCFGFKTLQLGSDVPEEILIGALKQQQPRVLWMSAHHHNEKDADKISDKSIDLALDHVVQLAHSLGTKVLLMQDRPLSPKPASTAHHCTSIDHMRDLFFFCQGLI